MEIDPTAADPEFLFRVVKGPVPGPNDFLSQLEEVARGLRDPYPATRMADATFVDQNSKPSFRDSEAKARQLALRFPKMGTHIAKIERATLGAVPITLKGADYLVDAPPDTIAPAERGARVAV